MLNPRIIPCLLIHNKCLVKTVNFQNPKYIGDPINAVKIFNEKNCDELIVLDIDATAKGISPDFKLIKRLAIESRMPLCYGGGVDTLETAEKIINLGVEKIALSSSALLNPLIIKEISNSIGSQSLVVVLDLKKKLFGGYDIYIKNGKKKINIKLEEFILKIQELGVGEIVFNSIDNDGVMKGYDLNLVTLVKPLTKVPITILGGAGKLKDIQTLIDKFKIIGASAGSLFVFKGKYKAVLINYPSKLDKEKLFHT